MSSLKIYAPNCAGDANDSIESATLGPILDTDVSNSNILSSSLLTKPQRLISSSLTINLVYIFVASPTCKFIIVLDDTFILYPIPLFSTTILSI